MARYLIAGSGHLAQRVRDVALASGHEGVRMVRGSHQSAHDDRSAFELLITAAREVLHEGIACAYLVDDREEANLELLVALRAADPELPIVLSLYNEGMGRQLESANRHLHVVNPARLAAPAILSALDAPVAGADPGEPTPRRHHRSQRSDPLIHRLTVAFILLLAGCTWYFHVAERLSWIDAAYFVTVTVATVGYGDINLAASSTASKLVGIGLIIASMGFVWLIFSLTIDQLIRKRVQIALGRRRHDLRGHVVVCGLGRIGECLVEGLVDRGERVIVVECDQDAPAIDQVRERGALVYVGDARRPDILEDVGIRHAKALFAVTNDDHTNLAIGLNARGRRPSLKVVLRVFDEVMSITLRERFGIRHTFSMSALACDPVFHSAGSIPAAPAAAPRGAP